jgi:hypothetical protein
MPNWCENFAIFEHPDIEMLRRLVAGFNAGATMTEFWPCPQALRDTVAGSVGDPEEQRALEEQHRQNTEQYGAAHWYDWCVNNWGTKWDFGYEKNGSHKKARITHHKNGKASVQLKFDTAWAPPFGFYAYMHDTHGFTVRAYYSELGMGFVGSSRNGSEDVINVKELTQDWLEDNVPDKICKIFNLYEYAAQHEENENV